jgi:hypothetical protein
VIARLAIAFLLALGSAAVGLAAEGTTGAGAAAPAVATPKSSGVVGTAPPPASDEEALTDYDEDLDIDPAEPDFEVINLPTTLRVPRHKLAFRLTHRFARPLGDGSFSDLLADFFGFDGGAQIGLGLRFGLFRGTQLSIYRTSDRTIQLAGQQELLREGERPLGLGLVLSIEGLNNFGLSEAPPPGTLHEFSPAVGLVLSKKLGTRAAVYAVPYWVGHTRINPSAPGTEDDTLLLGLGARLRLTRTMYVVGEYNPRLSGYKGDLGSGDSSSLASFGVEWRVGGHAFQINFSNALATTPGQIARGQQGPDDWFIGFNLSRKFY